MPLFIGFSNRSAIIKLPHRLAQYPVPQDLRDAFINNHDLNGVVPKLTQVIFCWWNYNVLSHKVNLSVYMYFFSNLKLNIIL